MREWRLVSYSANYSAVSYFLCLTHDPCLALGRDVMNCVIKDETATWRIIYRIDNDAIVIVEVFDKDDNKTPKSIIDNSKKRLIAYDKAAKGER